jgi:hypothetical protein
VCQSAAVQLRRGRYGSSTNRFGISTFSQVSGLSKVPGRLTASAFSAGGSLGQQSVEQLLRSAAYQLANGAPERLIRERFFGDLLGDPIDRDADGTDHRLPYALIYDALEQAGSGHETSVPRGVRGFTMVRLTLDRNTGDTPVL